MSTTTAEGAKKGGGGLAGLQRFGRSLMLPIATLPAAGILLRFGQDDLLGKDGLGWDKVAAVIGAAGNALFDFLPLLFAIGIAVGFARKGDGSTAVAAAVGWVVFNRVIQAIAPVSTQAGYKPAWDSSPLHWPYSVLTGIVSGIVAALLWQRYHRIKLPAWLAFFGGRRFVPIITAFTMIILGVLFGIVFKYVDAGIHNLGEAIVGQPVIGGGIYGFFNRLLIPVGLHQLLNVPMWFIFNGGDLTNFFSHVQGSGAFMTGFFPIFMFALPAAALAIWQTARPAQKKIVGGVMIAAALTSFITGVTEPIEFSFMFVAWPLYIFHAVMTGVSLALVNALDIHLGFSFSAGGIDFLLNSSLDTAHKAWLLIPIGLVFGVIYYFVFRIVITKWNLRTPGREDDSIESDLERTAAK
ncbi:PTS system, glucose/maltose/N-acetylglucosamine-specific IIC component [Amycolatopsis mediterranei S699]|uniref:PTS system, glucose/maltose/N-acetylglucosamine-specific IIC component n=2 Tax=Amycolatopsis mediterranei TaxID=33910 RepID=A0A0H3D1J9_AMYMU|nr:PTS transporter subunit EIIC [Amycolatopsis mediterranei]ADJ44520.1 PTS system, glucose/maltose/N-acetylglucosamine-specific IIC component [Amycolatopsis mediterranei U32]AEK41259.1 PTS system, glucose/maltose/N-acetylglucosamine-specific IIC component [Amycolatopsis mediterranei S699]AFO76233.1 PTS system, glucose/maltose/N-acetylglucosamine-specific IIC component [Amycolatopsis mediterranei S699]AGT83362.1 PTS system, glucose/maltose/N-acetylglucosamine-specific IIC component [Amycolatopsi